jgi:hypothetical protein
LKNINSGFEISDFDDSDSTSRIIGILKIYGSVRARVRLMGLHRRVEVTYTGTDGSWSAGLMRANR